MKQNEQAEGFSYTYSASEQEEIQRIRKKYASPAQIEETDKMERLRRLDKGVTKKGTLVSLVIGIVGALLMGTGMSCAMTDLGALLGGGMTAMLVGIGIGLVGILGVAVAYPIYDRITKKERERIAPEILRLTDELMK